MAKSREMPFFHGVTDRVDDQDEINAGEGEGGPQDDPQAEGDGQHHHEMHEDEAGGYHSKHTFPDGKVQEGDHASYDDAKADMDSCHGEGGDEGDSDGNNQGDDSDEDPDDVAGSYGRAAE